MPAEHPVPIRRLTLYKHGVAFIEREGAFEGDTLELTFRSDELDDALKSLLALDRAGGQVLGLAYDTPLLADERLADTPLRLAPDHSLLDLLRALRGHSVRLTVGDGSQSRTVAGRLIGLDIPGKRTRSGKGAVTVLEAAAGAVTTLPLAEVRQVQIDDDRAAEDLRALLDASRSEGNRRSLRLRLTPGSHDLRISYLLPSPSWRVSYRIVAETAGDGADGALLLQGWGIFDNRFGEDLDDVTVTLVAGQPISFRYDLTTSHIPERALVADEERVAPGPIAFHTDMQSPGPGDAIASRATGGFRAMRRPAPQALLAEAAPAFLRRADVEANADLFATAEGQGELFAYQVATPVVASRGASALVPVLQTTLPYRRLLLFNQSKLPDHPVAALLFVNQSGLTLERGPATVLEDGAYRGEAVVPFTRDGGDIYLACAVELGIRVSVDTSMTSEVAGLRIEKGLVHIQQAHVRHTRYAIQNHLPAQQLVTVEERHDPGAVLVDTRQPDSQTAEHCRWIVTCPPRQATRFQVSQRTYNWQSQQVLDQTYDQLAQFLTTRWLDAATIARLRRLFDEQGAIRRNGEERDRLEQEQTQLYQREEQLRQNMAALGMGGGEGVFRDSVVQRLQECEARVEAISARMATLQSNTERREAAIQQELATLEVNTTS